jgi:hypothetical protein
VIGLLARVDVHGGFRPGRDRTQGRLCGEVADGHAGMGRGVGRGRDYQREAAGVTGLVGDLEPDEVGARWRRALADLAVPYRAVGAARGAKALYDRRAGEIGPVQEDGRGLMLVSDITDRDRAVALRDQ